MALTKGQLESFSLICYGQIACQYSDYLLKVKNGLSIADQTPVENKFFRINSMLALVWKYDPEITTNCLTVAEITQICFKLMNELCFTVDINNIAETNLN